MGAGSPEHRPPVVRPAAGWAGRAPCAALLLAVLLGLAAAARAQTAPGEPAVARAEVSVPPGEELVAVELAGSGVVRSIRFLVRAPEAARERLVLTCERDPRDGPPWWCDVQTMLLVHGSATGEGGSFAVEPELPFRAGARFRLRNGGDQPVPCRLEVVHEERALEQLAQTMRLQKQLEGALLADNFGNESIDEQKWQTWVQDESLRVQERDGVLSVSGRSGLPGEGFRFTGLVSRRVRSGDAVLVARLRVPHGVAAADDSARNLLHLCGSVPDHFVEVAYGRDRQGRSGWWQGVNGRASSPPLFPEEDASDWREVRIDYSHGGRTAQGFLLTSDGWLPVGPPEPLALTTLKVELKVDVPAGDVPVRAEYAACRLYSRPSTAPVGVVVYRRPVPFHPAPELTVRLSAGEHGRPLGEGRTDAWGATSITLPDELVYPVDLHVEVWDGGRLVASGTAPRHGVSGLYPGDQWAVELPDAELAGHGSGLPPPAAAPGRDSPADGR